MTDLQNALLNRVRSAPGWVGPHDQQPSIGSQMNPPVRPNPVPQIPPSGAQSMPPNSPSGIPIAPTGLPAPPPNPQTHLPPAWQRYQTGLKMQQGYANPVSEPNPMITRLLNNK